MSEKYIDLAERIKRDRDTGPITGLDGETYALRWLDRNPEQVPGRTITESEIDEACSTLNYDEVTGFKSALDVLGVTVAPDPEPTNAERLEELVNQWQDEPQTKTLTQFLDEAGVRAPGGDE